MPTKITFPGVYVQDTPTKVRTITGVATTITAFIGPTRRGPVNTPVRILSLADFEPRFGALAPNLETGYAVRQYFQNGGTEAWVVRIAQRATKTQISKGLQALNAVDLFNLLVLPGASAPAVVAAAAEYCRRRRAFLIVDAPAAAKTPAQISQAMQGFSFQPKDQAAIYYPWIKITDPLNNGQTRLAPAGGSIAGLIARTDITRGVWKAPAGTDATLKEVQGLEYNLTDAENGMLNPRGVNCLRAFPASGVVAWGARTLAGDASLASEYKYVPVRRLALYLEESLDRGTRWVMFEPNDEPLWARLRHEVGIFMAAVWRQGALPGATPERAYFVKCDRETTSPTDIDNGVVNVVVGFAPLKPDEFIIIKLQQAAGQTTQ